jgi:hypothetical protein
MAVAVWGDGGCASMETSIFRIIFRSVMWAMIRIVLPHEGHRVISILKALLSL